MNLDFINKSLKEKSDYNLDYEIACKDEKLAQFIKKLQISKTEFEQNLDLFFIGWLHNDKNQKYEIVRNEYTNKLVSKITAIYSPSVEQKNFAQNFLLPEISFHNYDDFINFFKERRVALKKLPPLKNYKPTFKNIIQRDKLIYWRGGDSIIRSYLLKSFAIIFARNNMRVAYFNLAELTSFIIEKKTNLTSKLKEVDVLIIEFDVLNSSTNWFLSDLRIILIDRITSKKITFLGFDSDFLDQEYGSNFHYSKKNKIQLMKKMINLFETYGTSDSIWNDFIKSD
ncbi:hypothetical protein [Mycoplasma sp. 'Moose RK']|uniref:hypothetical protein n=1 Tax=Mycoplasma sp. 'Moose RK' TaxID=2780095 RepID=UPI0018C30A9D|nr:hypothetical protein [Mycoplasma sp. 'Moose RK']MBG0730689.1 hypothetical protein [Mycoplasma sp. 'Moose RK']